MLVTGLVILADWLASQDGFLVARQAEVGSGNDVATLGRRLERSREWAPTLLADAGLGQARLKTGTFQEVFPACDPPYDLQASVAGRLPQLATGPGLLLVTAPMGDGKTEAALYAGQVLGEASGATGLYVGLPTMATADEMYSRVAAFADRRLNDPAALTLLHSMAWLSDVYASTSDTDASDRAASRDTVTLTEEDPAARVAATKWLRGRKRGLLAPLAVGTVDQALLAALRSKHNALRMLGLSGRVLVIDEAHAYDAYMQALLSRLVNWLGALGVPVILLSATLPTRVGEALLAAYATGAGVTAAPADGTPSYPGWAFLDGRTGAVTWQAVRSERAHTLRVTRHPFHPSGRRVDTGQPGGRLATLDEALAPVRVEGGCVLVVCNTVAEAQRAYAHLGERFGGGDDAPELTLLHARFPHRQRSRITEQVRRRFGKDRRERPRSAVLVATQVVEQSLDLDFDLVISDLAPMAQLLQRAGRGHRHAHPRPPHLDDPHLAVLVPTVDEALAVPENWAAVYDRSLLRGTYDRLAHHGEIVEIPGDVQNLVDGIYREFANADPRHVEEVVARQAEEAVHTGLAHTAAAPEPSSVTSLYDISREALDLDEDQGVATRLGAPSVRVVCCFLDAEGDRWLDPGHTRPLPERGSGPEGRFTRSEVRALVGESIPVREAEWTRALAEEPPPDMWEEQPVLCDLALVPQPAEGDGGAWIGGRHVRLDGELGLCVDRKADHE